MPAQSSIIIDVEISMVRPSQYMEPTRSTTVKITQHNTQNEVCKFWMRISVTMATAQMVSPKFLSSSSPIIWKEERWVSLPNPSLSFTLLGSAGNSFICLCGIFKFHYTTMSVQNNIYIYLQIQKSLLLITSNEYTVITLSFGHFQ